MQNPHTLRIWSIREHYRRKQYWKTTKLTNWCQRWKHCWCITVILCFNTMEMGYLSGNCPRYWGSNLGPLGLQSDALPTRSTSQLYIVYCWHWYSHTYMLPIYLVYLNKIQSWLQLLPLHITLLFCVQFCVSLMICATYFSWQNIQYCKY